MAGAPVGNQNAARAKRVREAIMRALSRRAGSVDAGLDQAADALVKLAIESSDQWALGEMFNRIDGKPATVIIGDDESPPVRIHRIERVIVKPPNRDG